VATTYYDNPAGRLHALLIRLIDQPPNGAILGAWANVLEVDRQDVVLHIGGVADLVRQIQAAVDELDDEVLSAPVARLRGAWAKPIFPSEHAFNTALGKVLPSTEALESLALVAAQLHLRAPEGKVPDDEALANLKKQVRDLVDAVREADDLSDDVKQAIVGRLIDVEKAMEHVHVGGPDAVRRAMEAVMGAMARTANPMTARSASLQKLWVTLGVLWVAFSAAPTTQASLETWPTIVHEITSGQIEHPGDSPPRVNDDSHQH
jgi:hypothetical protein